MTKVRYIGGHDAVEVEVAPKRWATVERDGVLECSAQLANSLLEQPTNWQIVTKSAKAEED